MHAVELDYWLATPLPTRPNTSTTTSWAQRYASDLINHYNRLNGITPISPQVTPGHRG
jgi:hypothetical protein